MFVTLAGLDGSGKTTVARMLAQYLGLVGVRVHLTAEPGGTPLGRQIRSLAIREQRPLLTLDASRLPASVAVDTVGAWMCDDEPDTIAELFLFAAARAQHVAAIRGWLARGELVICDRFADCTWAYQGAKGVPDALLDRVNAIATRGLAPDCTLLLDADPRLLAERRRARLVAQGPVDTAQFDATMDEAYLDAVRARYLTLAARHPERITVLDASASVETIAHRAYCLVAERAQLCA